MASGDKELYVAVAVLELIAKDGSTPTLYEETFILVEGEDEASARRAASALASAHCTSYTGAEGNEVEVRVKELLDVARVLEQPLRPGVTLYARHFTDYEAYTRFEPLLAGRV